jgi:putative Ca2+/H+ antiporter (TMEM165/GDT1 family)
VEALFTSTALVALAEIGDKTMLLAIVLATRFRRPLPIIAGIFLATIANHALSAWAGSLAAAFFAGQTFRLVVAASFIVMGLWTLVPDKFDDDDAPAVTARGAFLTTLVAFFIVEMGDKTQLATVALGAQYHDVLAVAAGTTLGMMIANVPAVLLGDALVKRVSLKAVRMAAAALFVAVGIWMLAEAL